MKYKEIDERVPTITEKEKRKIIVLINLLKESELSKVHMIYLLSTGINSLVENREELMDVVADMESDLILLKKI